MKKKFLTMLSLLVIVYVAFFWLEPNSVLASNCDPSKFNSNPSAITHVALETDCTNAGGCVESKLSGTSANPYFVCWPKGPTTSTPIFSCPAGYGPVQTASVELLCYLANSNYKNKCCKTTTNPIWGGADVCADSSGKPIDSCAKVDSQAFLIDKSFTCSEPKYHYNDSSKVCEQFTADSYNITPLITCDNTTSGVQSAIGCIPTGDLPTFLGFILKFALGAAGGITLLMFIATGYTLITSTGNPEKLQAVKENLVSIFSGLVMIGFSLVLLQTIGAGVLKLPGF